MRFYNPFRVIREQAEEIAYLQGVIDELERRADTAEERAFRAASESYYQRSRMLEEQLKYTQAKMADIANLCPPSIIAYTQGKKP